MNNIMKRHPIYKDYLGDKNGNVYSLKPYRNNNPLPDKPRLMKLQIYTDSGYLYVPLYIGGGIVKKIKIHRFILECYIGKSPKGMQACHNDGNKENNKLENLRWDTHENNVKDRIKHGSNLSGEKNPRSKFNIKEIKYIRSTDISTIELLKKYKVHYSTINRIRKYITYKDI